MSNKKVKQLAEDHVAHMNRMKVIAGQLAHDATRGLPEHERSEQIQ